MTAPLRATWLRYLGNISYGLYLYHLSGEVATFRLLRIVLPGLAFPVPQLIAATVTLAAVVLFVPLD